jgi:hypothetical protein
MRIRKNQRENQSLPRFIGKMESMPPHKKPMPRITLIYESSYWCYAHWMSDDSLRRSLLWETILQKETYPIFRLTYLSQPVKLFTDADFDDIESKSVEANNARDVTGLLIVQGERILQILEGREASVRELYAKIEADGRHTITKLVCAVEDDERLLLTWSMVVRSMNGIPSEISQQFDEVYDSYQRGDVSEISLDHIDLFKTISLLGQWPIDESTATY